MRQNTLVDLWRKLTGDDRSSPREVYIEARHIFRKRHDNVFRTPSTGMRKWLTAAPTALRSGGAEPELVPKTPPRRAASPLEAGRRAAQGPPFASIGENEGRVGAWPGDMRKVRRTP